MQNALDLHLPGPVPQFGAELAGRLLVASPFAWSHTLGTIKAGRERFSLAWLARLAEEAPTEVAQRAFDSWLRLCAVRVAWWGVS